MSFLGGPECSTGSNPLAQFQKQTSQDTSLQRDRLTSRAQPGLSNFRTQQQSHDNGAFNDFQEMGGMPGLSESMDPVQFEQMRRELEAQSRHAEAPDWAREFQPMPDMSQQNMGMSGGFNPADFQTFRNSQMSPVQRNASPMAQQQPQSMYQQQRPMYGGMGMGMGMGGFQSRFAGSTFQPQPQQQQFEGKGKGRVQELDDASWQEQFDALNVQGDEADMEQLDREAEEAVERELNGIDR